MNIPFGVRKTPISFFSSGKVSELVADCLPDWNVIVEVERGSITFIGGPDTRLTIEVNCSPPKIASIQPLS